MNIIQQEESKRLDQKQLVYVKYKEDFDYTPALGASMVELNGINVEIADTSQQQLLDTKGTTKNRLNKRVALAEFTCMVAGGLSSLASDTNDDVLLGKCQITTAQLQAMNEKLVGPTCSNIKELALEYLPALAPYGITPALVQQFSDDIDAYIKLALQPKEKINDRSGYTQKLTDLFVRARLLEKNKIKKLLLNLKKAQPAAYDAYVAIKKPSRKNKTVAKLIVPPPVIE